MVPPTVFALPYLEEALQIALGRIKRLEFSAQVNHHCAQPPVDAVSKR